MRLPAVSWPRRHRSTPSGVQSISPSFRPVAMATVMELEASIGELKREEKALQLKLKAVRGKIAAAQL